MHAARGAHSARLETSDRERGLGEVGNMYAEDGREKPVTGKTGFWTLLPIIGAIVWFVKVQGALNRYWESKGAGGAVAATAPAAQ